MAQQCGFFNAKLVNDEYLGETYDRVYTAEQFAAYFASFIGNGVFGNSMQKLEVVSKETPGMSVQVLAGEAWINGWWYKNSDAYNLDLEIADGVLSRIDAIVLRWGNSERDMWLQVVPGERSANPTVPEVRRDADYYDLMLGYVTVSAGLVNITQAQITDTRLNNNVCGLVTGLIDQVDTTDLFNQFMSFFDNFKSTSEKDYTKWIDSRQKEFDAWTKEQQESFLSWADGVKGILSDDAALNLYNQIDALRNQVNVLDKEVTSRLDAFDKQLDAKLKELNGAFEDFRKYYEDYFNKLFFVGSKGQLEDDIDNLEVGTITFLDDDMGIKK